MRKLKTPNANGRREKPKDNNAQSRKHSIAQVPQTLEDICSQRFETVGGERMRRRARSSSAMRSRSAKHDAKLRDKRSKPFQNFVCALTRLEDLPTTNKNKSNSESTRILKNAGKRDGSLLPASTCRASGDAKRAPRFALYWKPPAC